MGILNFLTKVFGSSADKSVLIIYIRCDNCKSTVKLRIDLVRDLMNTYEDDGPAYMLIKEASDAKCHKIMNLRIEFSKSKKLLSQELIGGTVISEQEYDGNVST